jgi:hypothetical protein
MNSLFTPSLSNSSLFKPSVLVSLVRLIITVYCIKQHIAVFRNNRLMIDKVPYRCINYKYIVQCSCSKDWTPRNFHDHLGLFPFLDLKSGPSVNAKAAKYVCKIFHQSGGRNRKRYYYMLQASRHDHMGIHHKKSLINRL